MYGLDVLQCGCIVCDWLPQRITVRLRWAVMKKAMCIDVATMCGNEENDVRQRRCDVQKWRLC